MNRRNVTPNQFGAIDSQYKKTDTVFQTETNFDNNKVLNKTTIDSEMALKKSDKTNIYGRTLNQFMKNYQKEMQIKELVNIVTSNTNKELDFSVICIIFLNHYKVNKLLETLRKETPDIYENIKKYFITKPSTNSENKQVKLFISIMDLLLDNIESSLDLNSDNEKRHLKLLDAIFVDFIDHLKVNSIGVRLISFYFIKEVYIFTENMAS